MGTMRNERSPKQPEAIWKEKDMVNGEIADAMVVIMRTNGCAWVKNGGCTMCGYKDASLHNVTENDLMSQIDHAVSRYGGERFVKIYTSGSFLDDNEVSPKARERIFTEFGKAGRILIESRPEFVTEDSLSALPKNVTVALGLESCSDGVLEKSIHKGFTSADIKRAGAMIKEAGLAVRTYLLLKPLYMKESDSIDDAVASVRFADAFSDEISINPVNVQRRTQAEKIWKRAGYRPPWIWSLTEVFRRCSENTKARLMSSPSGGGSKRGVHNCGKCDTDVLKAIERFSFTQDIGDLNVECECTGEWKDYMFSETILGTSADLDRMLESDLALRR